MTGIVLCGGSSSRMGSDKGLLKDKNRTWAETAAEKLAVLHLPVAISVNERQVSPYSLLFPKEQLISDNNALPVKGPLLGLLSVHLKFSDEDLLVLACDMKDMNVFLLQNLFHQSTENMYDAFVYLTAEEPQPLCGIYTCNGLKKLYQMLTAGELKRFSMMHVLNLLNTKYISVSEDDVTAFNNYNSPDQL